jgi:hypothetical protein
MYDWFSAFASEVGVRWRSTLKFGAVTESMKDISDEEEITHFDVNTVAQEAVADVMRSAKGYESMLEPRRKTPAQVWSILEYDDFLHIALIKVFVRMPIDHMVLNIEKEKHTLEHLCVMVLKMLLKSDSVPGEIKKKRIVVSSGIAEVSIKDTEADDTPQITSSIFLGAFFSPNMSAIDAAAPKLKGAHKL